MARAAACSSTSTPSRCSCARRRGAGGSSRNSVPSASRVVAWPPMPDADAVTAATTNQWVGAAVALGVAIALVWVLRVLFARRARKLAESVLRGDLTPEVDTRLRLIERLVYAVVLCLGIAAALSKFDTVRDVGRALLTSGAIAAAVIGFAARQTLANVVAGVMIAITQPLRIGDWVEFDGHYGVVEDITLSYTTLRTGKEIGRASCRERV